MKKRFNYQLKHGDNIGEVFNVGEDFWNKLQEDRRSAVVKAVNEYAIIDKEEGCLDFNWIQAISVLEDMYPKEILNAEQEAVFNVIVGQIMTDIDRNGLGYLATEWEQEKMNKEFKPTNKEVDEWLSETFSEMFITHLMRSVTEK